jgi:multiple sugar transport system permease protein
MMRPGRVRDLVVLLVLALWALPFFWQALTSIKPDAELLAVDRLVRAAPTLAHYRLVLERSVMPDALLNSLGVAALTTLLALVLGVPGAYALARLPIPGSPGCCRIAGSSRCSRTGPRPPRRPAP